MAVLGSLLKQAVGGYAKKPDVPEFVPVDAAAQQLEAISGNLAALPSAQRLASQTNAFNLEQLQKMLKSAIPGYEQIQGQQSAVVQSMLRGELPKDVQNAIQNAAAARAIGGGYGGAGMQRTLTARDFGRTSYDITQQGLDSATRWMAATASMVMPQMMNVTSMFLSPAQRIQHAVNERNAAFNVQWTRNQIEAMPDPFKAALGDAFVQDEYEIMKLVGAAAGAAAGCWVAREVYGEGDVRWKLFRHWLLRMAPGWFRSLYLRYGQQFAGWLANKPLLKRIVRRWMDPKVELSYGRIISST